MARALVREIKEKRKNYIINGAMEVSQRGTSFVSILDSRYSIDRFAYYKSGAMVHTVTQDSDVPTQVQSGYTFKSSYRANLTTPDTSIATNEYVCIDQCIEGFNYSEFAQKAFTISFWVKATTPGIYSIALRNETQTRSLVYEYTINSANTWEKKVISIPAMNTSGTWNYGTGIGIRLTFTIAAGTALQTTPGAWQTGGFIAGTNQINGANTGATDFRLTGVMLNEGLTAEPFSLFSDNGYAGEFTACMRYYEVAVGGVLFAAPVTSGNAYTSGVVYMKVPKRVTPNVTLVTVGQSGFPGTVGAVGNTSNMTFTEQRTANATLSSAFFLSSYLADAELS